MAAHALSKHPEAPSARSLRRVSLAASTRTIETTVGELIAAIFDATENPKDAARLLESRQLSKKTGRRFALTY